MQIATRLDTRARVRARTLTQFHEDQKFFGSGLDFALGLLIAFVVICAGLGLWLR